MPPTRFRFQHVPPNENYQILRLRTICGRYELGLQPVIFGVRVIAGEVGCIGTDVNYCAGDDRAFQIQLLLTVLRILESLPNTTTSAEIFRLMPTFQRKPISGDPCWPALVALAEKLESTSENNQCN